MGFTYGPDGVIITSGGGVGTGLYGHVQGALGAANDAATIAAQVAQMNTTAKQLQAQGAPNLGQQAQPSTWQAPAPSFTQQPTTVPGLWAPTKSSDTNGLGLPYTPNVPTLGSDYPTGGLPPGMGKSGLPTITVTRETQAQKEANDKAERDNASQQVQSVMAARKADDLYNTTIKGMLDEIRRDPAKNPELEAAAQALAQEFKTSVWGRTWSLDEVNNNPLVREINNISIWSTYRRKVSEWQAGKNKLGTETSDAGDGSFATMVTGSFSQKTGTGNVPGFMVARDENGLLYITDVDTWINGRMADMKADPQLAASTITALASIQAYGGDSAANSAAGSRVVTDENGDPVKAFISNEDYTALKNVALLAINSQAAGNMETLEDFFGSLTQQSQEIYNDPNWEPPSSGSSGGSYYRGGGGYGGGYGGGGGGGTGAVRYADSEMLGAQVDAISRQRMGRVLSPEEKAEFVAYYHMLEENMTAAYYAGASTTQLDPEGQAVAWMESRFAQERGAHAYGTLAAQFMKMVGQGGFAGALSVGSNA
ncbi:hypothetical protein [Umezawaea sp. NPDC059074]|uniref:hypothetical protein n=1 Tax=Umezawaea sp. NPDC059074 TaxID=3346716 RepID=UPI0036BF98FA